MNFLAGLLTAERSRRGTRTGTRKLSCHAQAVLVLRWFLDGTRLSQLAGDNTISKSTAYDYIHEGIDALAARAPSLHNALLAAKTAGYCHVIVDGTLIETDRVAVCGPTAGVDLWWSGKHHQHGGNIQIVSVPDGWPIWTSGVRPGREHDTTAARADPQILPVFADTITDLRILGDLGYEGESGTIVVAFKKPKHDELTTTEQQFDKAHNRLRAFGERANAVLKMTFKALRNISLCPWRIGTIAAAALVLLHFDLARTT